MGWGSTRSCASASSVTAREPLNASWLGQRFLSPGPRELRHRKAVWARAVQTHTLNVRSHGLNVCSRGAAFPRDASAPCAQARWRRGRGSEEHSSS